EGHGPGGSAVRAEPDAALAREALHVDDAAQEHRVAAVVGLEGKRAVTVAAECTAEVVGGHGRDEHRQDLRPLEGDLDPDALKLGHRPPTLPGPRRSPPDERTRPGARRARAAAARRSAARRRPGAARARRTDPR